MRLALLTLCLWSAVVSTGAAAPQGAASPSEWRRDAARDLTAVHDMLRDNHPAILVRRDSGGFRAWLERGYRQALADLPKVQDEQGYRYLLNGYAGGFRDGHIWVYPLHTPDVPVQRWPGISTRWSNGRYVVADVPAGAPDTPPVGSRLLACDGRSAERLARERLDRYEGDLDLESGRFYSAKSLLWDSGNPFAPAPAACAFDVSGRTRTYPLRYRAPQPEEIKRAGDAATPGPPATFDVAPWGAGAWWIGLPSLAANPSWGDFFAKVERHRDEIRAAPVVVIDVRGDFGGDSSYADRLAEQLWGKAFVEARAPAPGPVVYRASPLNRAQFEKLLKEARADPQQADNVRDLEQILALFDKAAATGNASFTVTQPATPRPHAPLDAMQGRVVILTDHACASACLDLMDLFLAMPRVVQAGVTTYADTIFMETTTATLPSGRAVLGFGHKAWVARRRGSGVAYSPGSALTYRGDPADDAQVRAWLARALRLPVADGAGAGP